MSIMELGALGEFVAAFGVIASLIYVGFQVRQNTKATNGNAIAQVASRFSVISWRYLKTMFLLAHLPRCVLERNCYPSNGPSCSIGSVRCFGV